MDDLVSAVRELRAGIGDSQQAFATKLGMSLRAIANYEGGREPSGKALYKLDQLARANGRPDLAARFTRALALEMDWSHEPEQPVWSGVVREIVRNKHLCSGWPGIATAMIAEMEALLAKARTGMHIDGPLKDQQSNIANLERWLVEARYSVSQSAERELERLAQQWHKLGLYPTYEQAYTAVLIQYPDLYTQFKAERATAARGTQYEASLATPYLNGESNSEKKRSAKSSRRAKTPIRSGREGD